MLSAIKYGWNDRNGGAQYTSYSPVYCAHWNYFGTTPSILSTRSTRTRSNNRTKYCQYWALPAVQLPQIAKYSTAVVNTKILRVWHYLQYKISKYLLRVLAVSEVFSLGNFSSLFSQVLGASLKTFVHRYMVPRVGDRPTYGGKLEY